MSAEVVAVCAVRGCDSEAIWTSSFVGPKGRTYIVPVCREHGTEMSPHHGVMGLEWLNRRTQQDQPHANDAP